MIKRGRVDLGIHFEQHVEAFSAANGVSSGCVRYIMSANAGDMQVMVVSLEDCQPERVCKSNFSWGLKVESVSDGFRPATAISRAYLLQNADKAGDQVLEGAAVPGTDFMEGTKSCTHHGGVLQARVTSLPCSLIHP